MALPSIADLKMWVGSLLTKDDWNYNFSKLVGWLVDGTSDIVVNSIKSTNGIDLGGSQIYNLRTATEGSQAVNLDQALTLLNRTSYYYPFSVAAGKVDNDGNAAFLQKDSDTQVTVLGGNVNPDLVCILSDGTIESVTSNTVLTVPVTDGTYHIVKEKDEAITITTGSANKVTVGKKFPSSQNTGDYFLDNSTVPFTGYKYGVSGWEETPFCYLGYVTVSGGTATVTTFVYNNNKFDVNARSLDLVMADYSKAEDNKTVETWHTATQSGYLHLQTESIDDRNDPYLEVRYNGVTRRFRSAGSTTATEHFYFCIFVNCPKGAEYYIYAGNSGATLSFIPCVGGN